MTYYYVFDGRKIHVKSLAEARDRVLVHLLTAENNMECMVPLFDEGGHIAELDYLKELNGKVYFCYGDCRNLKTMRTYFDLNDPRVYGDGKISMFEIQTMRGKQLLAKDVYEVGE